MNRNHKIYVFREVKIQTVGYMWGCDAIKMSQNDKTMINCDNVHRMIFIVMQLRKDSDSEKKVLSEFIKRCLNLNVTFCPQWHCRVVLV